MKIEPYKQITLKGSIKDDGSFEEWQHIDRVIKQAEEQFMKAQLAKDVDKIIKDFNEKYDLVVIPSRCVKSLWQTEAGYLKFTVVAEEDGRMMTFINHDSIHLI